MPVNPPFSVAVSLSGRCPVSFGVLERTALLAALFLNVLATTSMSGQTYQVLHSFSGADGAYPFGALLADSGGNLYGTTERGGGSGCGGSGCGTVFKLDANNNYALTTLHSFSGSDGSFPYAGLIPDSAGNLYGTTANGGTGSCYSGCGTVFKLAANNNYALTTLHSFSGSDGWGPDTALIADSAGNLYGTTAGGTGGTLYGSVFRLDAGNNYALTTLHGFAYPDAAEPLCELLADSAGNLYGTTYLGGSVNGGTVFKLDAGNSYALTTLHIFAGFDGANPAAALIADSTGSLYGTTSTGGGSGCQGSGCGAVFKLDASNGYALRTLHDFRLSDGATPFAPLIADSSGNLYGTTSGFTNYGTVFKLGASNGYALTTLYSFTGGTDGKGPTTALIADSAGSLYGTTESGGAGSVGVVFRICFPPTATITVPSWVVVGATGIVASVPNHAGSTYNWTLSGGTIIAGQGSSTILLRAAPPGTRMVLGVLELSSTGSGCPLAAGTTSIQVDFLDVPPTHAFHDFVDTIARNAVSTGCGAGNYCADDSVTRAEMAVFLLRAEHGSSYVPPACLGFFLDVPCPGGFAVDWIEQLSLEGLTAGCGGGNYCPGDPVTRAQMAVFLLKAEHGPAYTPPACTPPGIFVDVPCPGGFAVDWIEQLSAEGITSGCGGGNYCPDSPNTRGQMAVFLVKTFNLP